MTPTFVQAEDTVQTIGADVSRNAERITYQANPSGVVYSLLFAPWPSDIWTPKTIQQQADLWETRWNTNRAVPGVTGISVTQQTSEVTSNLEDVAFVGVKSTSGLSTSLVELPLPAFWPDEFAKRIAAERAALDAIEAGGT